MRVMTLLRARRSGVSAALLAAGLMLGSCTRAPAPGEPAATLPAATTTAGRDGDAAGALRAAAAPGAALSMAPPALPLPQPLAPGGSRAVPSAHGLVVSGEAQATRAGVRMLERGGNAVDAAVATAYALAVTHPSAGNIGGGGFMLVARPGEETAAIDFRERAPALLDAARFQALLAADARGPAASAVPGSVAGLNLAQRKFGRLALAQVLAPAIELAQRGASVSERLATTLRWSWPELSRDPEARRIFGVNGAPVRAGARLLQPELAVTLARIARAGDAGFYAGDTALALERAALGQGSLRAQDLAEYRAELRAPLTVSYRGYRVETMPPSSSGGFALAQILVALGELDAGGLAQDSVEALHWFIEVDKRAQAERRFELGDPDVSDAWPRSALARRLGRGALLSAFPPIAADAATPSSSLHPLYPAALRELEHTTHLGAIDREGMAVSLTTTLSAGFGARYVADGTGIVMNNSLAAFGSVGKNSAAAGKRMSSSMAPTLLYRGTELVAVLGSPGGDTIPSTLAALIWRLVDQHLPIDAAIEAPRVHHGFVPDEVRVERERSFPGPLLDALRARGHRVQSKAAPLGAAHGISRVAGVAYGYADPREGGLALGPAASFPSGAPSTHPGEPRR